ncbi:MAG: NHLP bacteriocin export ABC transporter permease/ATPase subunit [Acidobacteriota bacterium]
MSDPLQPPTGPPALAGNEVLPLPAGSPPRLVTSGRFEVFARLATEDGGWGRRLHLGSAETGDALCGVEGGKLQLIAVSAVPSTIAPVTAGTPPADLHRGIDGWLELLFDSVSPPPPPKRFIALSAGEETVLEKKKTVARSDRGVQWVRLLEGEARFLGRASFPLDGQTLPVGRRTWVKGAADSRLSAQSTATLVADGRLGNALEEFHRTYIAYLEEHLAGEAEADRERVARQSHRDRAGLAAAHGRLTRVLGDDGGATAAAASAATEDPILAVCRMVGQALGLTIQTPAESPEGKRRSLRFEEICSASRVRWRRVLLRDDWWRQDNGPLIAYLAEDDEAEPRPVALLPISARRYHLVDPSTGERHKVDGALAERLDGSAFMLYPPLPERAVQVRDLARAALRGRGRDLTTILAMGVAGGLVGLVVPLMTGRIFGHVIPSADRSQLAQMTLGLIISALAAGIFQITRSIAVLRLGGKVDGTVQAAVWDRLLSLPVSFFRRFSVGDLADRSMGLDSIRELFMGNVTTSLLTAIFSVFSFGLLFYFSRPLALIATLVVAVLLLVTGALTYIQVRRQRPLFELQGKIASLLLGIINGLPKLRISGAEQRAYSRWAERFAEQREQTLEVRRITNAQAALNSFYGVIASLAIFAMVGFSSRVDLPIGEFLAFNAAFGQFLASSFAILGVFSSILTMVPIYERVQPILETPPEVDVDKADAGELAGDIEFGHVSFRYEDDGPLILDDVSFRAGAGEFVALVGPSGSGKSTCIRLILAFESPQSGSIYFDGQDLSTLAVQSVRRQIGVVLQHGQPMVGDIYSNIVGSSDLGIQAAWEAAAMAGLAEDIQAMPMGMHTVISEGAGTFSGGQKQRLLIARAVVHRPRILLFDEATSALDNRTQEIVSRSLENLKATRIVVAHRLSTIVNADRIVVIDKGRVVETGTYEELAAAGGVFARLIERQVV